MNSKLSINRFLYTAFALRRSLFAAAVIILAARASADVIFDNSVHDLGRRFDPGELEVGDEIEVVGAARYVTNFNFEYWGDSTAPGVFAGNVEARVRFYRNDGSSFNGFAAPGTLFYDSGWFGVAPTLRSQLIFLAGSDFPPGGLYLPVSNFTWTVQFQGMSTGDSAGVDLYSPIETGFSYSDYWQNDPGGWALKTNSALTVNFAAQIQAYSATPPSAPTLRLAYDPGQITLAWPSSATSFVLETTDDLRPDATWTRITQGISISDGLFIVNRPATAPAQFYRLHEQ